MAPHVFTCGVKPAQVKLISNEVEVAVSLSEAKGVTKAYVKDPTVYG
jgi:hypothetical protein